jgi:hypothetical protein
MSSAWRRSAGVFCVGTGRPLAHARIWSPEQKETNNEARKRIPTLTGSQCAKGPALGTHVFVILGMILSR